MTEHSPKALEFWARCREKRQTPGRCSRCGGPNTLRPRPPAKRGICQRCRDKIKAYKQSKRQVPITVDNRVLSGLASRVASLERRQETIQKHWRNRWNDGYRAGLLAERKRNSTPAADWDAWKDQLDITDKRRMSHRVRLEA